MIAGDKNLFAIECLIKAQAEKNQVLGVLLFWVQGHCIGDPEDTVYITGALSRIEAFIKDKINRNEESLSDRPAEDVFRELHNDIYATSYRLQKYNNAYGRFDISHLGMSSFDGTTLFLIEDEQFQRIVWKYADKAEIHEGVLPTKEVQRVARILIDWYYSPDRTRNL